MFAEIAVAGSEGAPAVVGVPGFPGDAGDLGTNAMRRDARRDARRDQCCARRIIMRMQREAARWRVMQCNVRYCIATQVRTHVCVCV